MNAKYRISGRWTRCGLAVLLALVPVFAAEPAEACGCGMVLPHEGSLDVTQERAIIRWDGQTEDIIMALQVQGDAKEAAWIMPVPTQAQVKLGDPKMFEFLQEFTKPLTTTHIVKEGEAVPGAGGLPPVTLLDRQEVGLYDVSTLAATDATALTQWLNTNGYKFPEAAATVLQSYMDRGWYYIAARISPSKTSQVRGELDPLWMTFKSDHVVYPMRPTALARNPEAVFLYILADHRMDIADLHTSFAGWISPADLPAEKHPIQQVVDRKYFLTKLQTVIYDPKTQVTDDYYANQALDDEYRYVEYVYRYATPTASPTATATVPPTAIPAVTAITPVNASSGETSFPFGVALAGLALVAVIVGIAIRRRRKGSASG